MSTVPRRDGPDATLRFLAEASQQAELAAERELLRRADETTDALHRERLLKLVNLRRRLRGHEVEEAVNTTQLAMIKALQEEKESLERSFTKWPPRNRR